MTWLKWFRKDFLMQNSQETPVPDSFLIKLQVSMLQLHWKKGPQHKCFLMNFGRYIKTPFLHNTSKWRLLFYGKIFYQYDSKKPSEKKKEKEKNGNSLTEKQRQTQNKNLITTCIKPSYHFTIQIFFYFSFLCVHNILKTRVIRNNAVQLRIDLL